MLKKWDLRIRAWATNRTPWTNVYGLARTLLALGTLLTLLFSHSSSLFRPASGMLNVPRCDFSFSQVLFFCQFSAESLEIARWVSIIVLLIVASGWRPRITGILHWYVAWSFNSSAMILDGGDQVTIVLTTLLLPLTLTDPRKWHWDTPPSTHAEHPQLFQRLLACSTFLILRIQVCGIYFHAATAKFRVQEWLDGTAIYYWWTDPILGLAPWLKTLMLPLLYNSVTITLLTWGPLLVELVLFSALFIDRKWWPYLLKLGIIFHAVIAITIGLISFGLAMTAALILYLQHYEDVVELPSFLNRFKVPLHHTFY